MITDGLHAFNSDEESWTNYADRLEQYFAFKAVEAEKKVSAILYLMGSKTYNLLKDLVAPNNPTELSFREILEVLSNHLDPKPIKIAERFKFSRRRQHPGETIKAYVADLRNLSKHCEYGAFLDDALTQQFVCGLKSPAIQKKLLTEANINFAKAVEIAGNMQEAAVETEAMQLDEQTEICPSTVGLHKLKPRNQNQQSCWRCKGQNHDPENCLFKQSRCFKCGMVGHIRRSCKYGTGPAGKTGQRLGSNQVSADAAYECHNFLNHPNTPTWVELNVNEMLLKTEVDTGSAFSLISFGDYQRLFKGANVYDTDVTLTTYTGQKVFPIGFIQTKVKHDDKFLTLKLYVMKSKGPPLMGRDWLNSLAVDLNKLFYGVSTSDTNCAFLTHSEMGSKSTTNDDHVFVSDVTNSLQKYDDLFSEKLGCLKHLKGTLLLKENATPKFCKARALPYSLRDKVEYQLDKLVNEGILEPVNWSEWATPIVPVLKKDGSVRLCGDFKITLNPNLNVQQYPLPKIDDILTTLTGGKRFSKIDLKQAYLHMVMDDKSKSLLVINTHKGLFRFTRLPFGVAAAPALWQQAIDQVLQGLPYVQCLLDDMMVTGRNDDELLRNLENVLKRLHEYGLSVNKNKCEFFKDQIEYCGYVVDCFGVHKSKSKINAIVKCKTPANVSDLRSFLGLVNYYHKFLPNLSTVLHPLYELLEKNAQFVWSANCQKAFEEVKTLISSDLVLAHYDPKVSLKIECDASPVGVGAVLSHVYDDGSERPIAFASKSLSKTERNYAQIDKEALAIVWSIKKFNTYLFGRHFTIVTDHQPLTSIFHPDKSIPTMTAARLQRYALFMAAHDYSIRYRSTKLHGNADGLSRLPILQQEDSDDDEDVDCFYVNHFDVLPIDSESVARCTKSDPILSKVLNYVMCGNWRKTPDVITYFNKRDEISVHQGCLVWGVRVIIPESLRKRVLNTLHDAHQGIVKMKALARGYIWWPKIDVDLENVTKSCDKCLQARPNPKLVPLHPWERPGRAWERVHIDFAGPFMNDMFLIVVDAYSKWPEVVRMNTTTSSATINVLRTIFSRYGYPEQLVSDNGPQFSSLDFNNFLQANGIRHITSAPWHPASNGLAERFVQTFKNAMTAMRGENSLQANLDKFLIMYRNTPHSVTNECPSVLFIGRKTRMCLDLLCPTLLEDSICEPSLQTDDNSRPQKGFCVGDKVAVKDYRGKTRWATGVVVSCVGNVMYNVQIAPNIIWKRHVDQMMLYSGPFTHKDDDVDFNGPPLVDASSDVDSVASTPCLDSATLPSDSDQNTDCTSEETSEPRHPVRTRNPPSYYHDYFVY